MKFVKISAFALLGLMAALPALADSTALAPGDVSNYLTAVLDAGVLGMTCPGPVQDGGNVNAGDFIGRDLEGVTSGSLDSTGAQPVLTLVDKINANTQAVFFFTTSSDYKKVVQMDISFQSLQQVNAGNIIAPNLVTEFVETEHYSCH